MKDLAIKHCDKICPLISINYPRAELHRLLLEYKGFAIFTACVLTSVTLTTLKVSLVILRISSIATFEIFIKGVKTQWLLCGSSACVLWHWDKMREHYQQDAFVHIDNDPCLDCNGLLASISTCVCKMPHFHVKAGACRLDQTAMTCSIQT
jgi:hypothetical protein